MNVIQTPRLRLRPFLTSDLSAFTALYADPEVCRYLLHEALNECASRQKLTQKLEQKSLKEDSKISLAVIDQRTEKLIGDISAWSLEMPETIEIGFAFTSESQGQGFATEALAAFLDFLVAEYPLHRVTAQLDTRNKASAALCQRLNLRKEAHFRQDYWSKGEWTDTFVFAQLVAERVESEAQNEV